MRLFAAAAKFALVVGIVAVTATAAGAASSGGAVNPFDQVVPLVRTGQPMPTTRFVDQRGRPFAFSDLRGSAAAVAFVYTRCRDACPIITRKFAAVRPLLGAGAFALVEVTIDPRHDTPGVLAQYAREYRVSAPQWLLLTGDPGAVDRFDRSMGMHSIASGPDTIIHDERIVLVAPDGDIEDVIEGSSWTPADLAAELRHLDAENSSWLARLDLALGAALAYCGGALAGRAGIVDLLATIAILGVGIWAFTWVVRRTGA